MIFGTHLPLHTERLLLRDFVDQDLPAYQHLRASKALADFYPEEECSGQFSENLLVRFMGQAGQNPRKRYQLAVVTKEDKLIGSCGIRVEDESTGLASFGCELDPEYWGHGYAREISNAVLVFGLHVLEIKTVYAEILAENRAALALAYTLGFVESGEPSEPRQFRDRTWPTLHLELREDVLSLMARPEEDA